MSGARHLLSLINEVLDIAAIEAGRLSLSLDPVALADVAAEAVSLIRPLADQHQVVQAGPSVSCTTHVLGDRLLDLHLPDMSGEAVLRRLRTSPVTADIPVAILSADARPALIERLLGEGVRGFLTKPLDVKELLALVDGMAAEREQVAAR